MLKDLEKEILIECRHRGLKEFELTVGPHQLLGIEINPYAFDLAQMTVWIGFIQWQKDNGFPVEHEPILQALHNFELKDAILDLTDPEHPANPTGPTPISSLAIRPSSGARSYGLSWETPTWTRCSRSGVNTSAPRLISVVTGSRKPAVRSSLASAAGSVCSLRRELGRSEPAHAEPDQEYGGSFASRSAIGIGSSMERPFIFRS